MSVFKYDEDMAKFCAQGLIYKSVDLPQMFLKLFDIKLCFIGFKTLSYALCFNLNKTLLFLLLKQYLQYR